MAGLHSRGIPTLILGILLFQIAHSGPVNISPQSVPVSLVQRAIDSLNQNSPTQHTYRGGNLISAQKLLEPSLVVYRLTLYLDTICSEGLTNCPQEACAIDLKERSGEIEVDRNSIQCMYLYPQSAQEDVQQVQQTESISQEAAQAESSVSDNAEEVRSGSQNTLHLDLEVEAAADRDRPESDLPDRPFIAVRAPNPNYCSGCPYELNPNLPGLAAFGVQALDLMDRQGQNDFKHKLTRIIKVTRAVPPGSNVVQYKLLVEVGETNCLKTTLVDRSECSLQGNLPLKICLITFEERPWQQSDRQVVGNNCTELSDLDNEINAGLNPGLSANPHLVSNGQPERVDSVQEVIGKTAHIDQLAQEGKIGTYDSLIDQILASPAANVTPEINVTEVPYFEGILPRENSESYASIRRDIVQQTNKQRPVATETPFVKVELEREEGSQQVHGFVDKQREFDEFLSDFDIPLRDPVTAVTEENRRPVVEEMIRPQRVGDEHAADSTEEDTSAEFAETRGDPQRTKRALTKTSVSETTLIEDLADKAVRTLDDIDKDNNKRVVRRILDSKKQKVDGYHYYLTIEVALTDCREEDDYQTDTDCLDKTIGQTKICKVQVHTDEENPLLSARVVKSECTKKETGRGKNVRNRRSPAAPGSPTVISVDDPDVRNFTDQAVRNYSKTSTGQNELILVKIRSATRQVVAGSLYMINITLGTSNCPKGTTENCRLLDACDTKECQIKIWSRPWLTEGGLNIEISCDENTKTKQTLEEKKLPKKRSTEVVGAPSAITVDDDDVKNYAQMGVRKFSQTYGGTNEHKLIEIVSATSQVVAGTLYRINVILGESDCPKGTTENCQLLANSERKECEIKAWSRPWLTEGGLDIQVNCDANRRSKRSPRENDLRKKRSPQAPGVPSAINVNDADVQNYAKLGVRKFSQTSGGANEHKLIDVVSASRQVVAGTLYKIIVTLGESNCPTGTTENCQLLANSERKECEIKAWSRPWLTEGNLDIQVNCDANRRSKRSPRDNDLRKKRSPQALGAPSAINVNDADVQNYAKLGVRKFSQTSGGANEHKLIDVVSASRQVVAGTLYRIIVTLGKSNCPTGTTENCQLLANSERKECEVKAWSRPWLTEGNLDIQVNCDANRRSKRGLKGKNYSQKMLQQSTYLKNERLFNDFVVKYSKSYSSTLERKNRFKIFHQNMMLVQELQRNEQGTAVYGASMFADLTTEEFKKNYLGLKPELRLDNEIPIPMADIPSIEIPNEYDWRNYNVVTPVKNQGSCGSCWAFSVTGNVEGQYALRHGTLLSFSEQELVDCDTLDEGCNGGLPDNAYRAIEKLGGLELESDYSYDGENESCRFNKTEVRVRVVSAVNITSNETQMAQWLVQNGPISIGINANAMQFYMGGVSHPFKFLCSPDNLDHGVLIVGYGIHTYPIFHKTLPYWTIKNSWGPGWGEQGYYRVYRGDGTCGVNQMASSAIVA